MLDPFPSAPPSLQTLCLPLARALNLPTLPFHIHEILLAFLFYNSVNLYFSPLISAKLFPVIYPSLNRRTKLNWDVHVVSLVQSCLINALALWILWTDEERAGMEWEGRVWGYTGAGGMIQGFAAGYFLWDLGVCLLHIDIFGWGLLAHAIAALTVFMLGFRPFVNFYGPIFILYELSSPFLNFHWFFDKLNMTGSRAQLYNGLVLLFMFFCCRLVWGTYQSVRVSIDMWAAIQSPGSTPLSGNYTAATTKLVTDAENEVMKYASANTTIPAWLALSYLGSNIVLNSLNFYWFTKMVEAVKKRFRPAKKIAAIPSGKQDVAEEKTETISDEPSKAPVASTKEIRRRRG